MTTPHTFSHSRFAKTGEGYELSSHGDRRFSALFCRLRDGRTIEQAYQLDVKGYRAEGNDWRLGKGKPSINGKTPEQLWNDYLNLWVQWTQENPAILEDLRVKAAGKILTDKFASSSVSQARALALILNDTNPEVAVALHLSQDSSLRFNPSSTIDICTNPKLLELP